MISRRLDERQTARKWPITKEEGLDGVCVCVNFAHSRQQADEEILRSADVTGHRSMENQSIYQITLRYILLL